MKICPRCNEKTFCEKSFGRECTKCGYKMTVAPNDGKGGRGRRCSNCGRLTVFNEKCSSCGAKYR